MGLNHLQGVGSRLFINFRGWSCEFEMSYSTGQIKLFGGLQVLNSETTQIHISGSKEKALIIALALDQGQALSRDSLTTRIWDRDDFQARKTLNTSLWRLRKSIRESGLDCDDWFDTGSDYLRLRKTRGPIVDYTQICHLLIAHRRTLDIRDSNPAVINGQWGRCEGSYHAPACVFSTSCFDYYKNALKCRRIENSKYLCRQAVKETP